MDFDPQGWSVDDFEFGKPLGRGKYGHVYLARTKKEKYVVALKVLYKKQLVNYNQIEPMRREIELQAHLQDEHVVRLFGYFWDEKKIYLILEYCHGGEVFEELSEHGRFGEDKAIDYIRQTCQAIEYLHSKNIIHRDIKPENLLNYNGVIKLADFGMAVHCPQDRSRKTFCGTQEYLAPEIVGKKAYNKSVDIWALGVLAYELLYGHAPF